MPRIVRAEVPERLHREIQQAAARNRRSVNAEILVRLEESFGHRSVHIEKLLERIRRRRQSMGALDLSDEVLRQMKDEGRP